MRSYKALLLDMDGTIMDSLDTAEQALVSVCKKWNIPMTEELLFLALYSSTGALLEAINLGDNSELFQRDLADDYRQYSHLVKTFPDIEMLMDAPIPKGIVTSEERDELLQNLDMLKIPSNRFAGISCAGDTPFLKPHPRPLLYCLEQMNMSPDDALYVGDSINDLLCARAAGVDFGLALWGTRDAEACSTADYIFSSPKEITKLL